jgi:hypothetical protein
MKVPLPVEELEDGEARSRTCFRRLSWLSSRCRRQSPASTTAETWDRRGAQKRSVPSLRRVDKNSKFRQHHYALADAQEKCL